MRLLLSLSILFGAFPSEAAVQVARQRSAGARANAPIALTLTGVAPPALPASPVPAAAGLLPAAPAPTTLEALSQTGSEIESRPDDAGATLDRGFEGRQSSGKETVQGLAQLRRDVQKDARTMLRGQLGGDVADGILHRDVARVLKRLTDAAGLPPESVQVFIGNSFLPNGFTALMESEQRYLKTNAHLAKAFRISNVFVSLGLLRACENEAQLAVVLAHELMHNWKGHLKGFQGSHQLLGHFHEFEADAEGLKLAAKAGYDPRQGIDMLYAMEKEMARIEKDYALLGRDKNELTEMINRIRDVHPHPDLRKANMLEHMNVALELYRPRVGLAAQPRWMQRRAAVARPSHLDRYEARLMRVAAAGAVEPALRELERFLESEAVKRGRMTIEEQAIVEKAYRALAARARTADELRYIEVSAGRLGQGASFPSRRLKAALVTRQLDLSLGRSHPTLEGFQKLSPGLGETVRRAGTLRSLGSIRTREELDGAYRALSREAENLGLDLAKIKATSGDSNPEASKLTFEVSRRLWKAARLVLEAELKRPPLPEEIVDELSAKLSPSWLKSYRRGLNVELIETAFGPEAYRSRLYAPSELAARLAGLRPEMLKQRDWNQSVIFEGLSEWSARHYRPHTAVEANGRVKHTYERFYLDGISSPSERDQRDLLRHFWKQDITQKFVDKGGYQVLEETDPLLPPPLIRLLRQEGRLSAFVRMAFDDRAADLKRRLAATAVAAARKEALSGHTRQSELLLKSALQGAHKIADVAETLSAGWERTEALLGVAEFSAVSEPENRSQLADAFFGVASDALRRSVIKYDRAGLRPEAAELGQISALTARIDAALRPFSGVKLVRAYAENLAAHSRRGTVGYMKAFRQALPGAAEAREKKILDPVLGLPAGRIIVFLTFPVLILLAIFWTIQRSWRQRIPPLAGIAAADSRALNADDFTHFMALLGDPAVTPRARLMAAALIDRLDPGVENGEDALGEAIGMQASTAVGRWLVEDAVAAARAPRDAAALAVDLGRLNGRHPGFLQPDWRAPGEMASGFQAGAEMVRRNEPLRSVLKGQHPFRGVNSRWALNLAGILDETGGWPAAVEDRFDLLDLMNSTGEFSDVLDRRILSQAKADRDGFARWMERDRQRLARWGRDFRSDSSVTTPFGIVPLPTAEPLRLVRNPALRAQLFDLLPESKLAEKGKLSWRQRWEGYRRLVSAYRQARKYFSKKFLKEIQHEGSLEEKFIEVLEEADRVSTAAAAAARARWDKGRFTRADLSFFDGKVKFPQEKWKPLLAHEKEKHVASYRAQYRTAALAALQELYTAFAGVQEPVLALLLDNYPEPTRSRDELLERVMKARKLTPGTLSFLEAHKSYRQPNPVRVAEKNLLDTVLVQMKKFTAAERVRILLHVAGLERLSRERQREYDGRILSGDRRKLSRDMASIRSIRQMESYLSLLHAKDKTLVVRALFLGETSLHRSPRIVRYLYLKLVIDKRGLPPFLEKVFRAYFEILTPDERSRLVANLAAAENIGQDLKGPEIMRIALKGMGVTGAKVAQVLATHKGLLPPEYAQAFESFKDRAQDMEKMNAFQIAGERLAGLGAETLGAESSPSSDPIDAWVAAALPKTNERVRGSLLAQVRFLLKEERGRVRAIESLGAELGSGSIKVVYKVTLEDKRVWVVKLRAPGAAYSIGREFEIIDQLVAALQTQGALDFPGAKQLLEEVQALVRSEMNFVREAQKEDAMRRRVASRPWYAALFAAAAPHVPRPHAVYASEDLLVEEFVPTTRFADLPRASLIGPSQKKIAALAVREGMFALAFENWLEPDPHTGNRHARRGGLYRFWTRLVLMDLGQGEEIPFERIKPLMRAAAALRSGDARAAAAALVSIMKVPDTQTARGIEDAVVAGLGESQQGVIERLMHGLLAAEKKNAIVKPEYASLQKAFILYAGYSPYLPKDYIYRALERAVMAKAFRDRPIPLASLVRLYVKRLLRGSKAVRAETEDLIERL